MAERALPVRGIAVFEAAARAVSFHAAAEELNLTPSAVSHQIRLLEETLGVKLFERVGRGVTLTAEGAEYASSVRSSMRRLRVATNQIKLRAKMGRALEVVRIEAPPSLAHCWLLPRLPELIAQHPGVDIRVNAQGSHLQGDRLPWPPLADAPADIQLVYGDDKLWADRAAHLLAEDFQPLCTPALLEQGNFTAPEALLEHRLLSTSRNAVTWEEWFNWQRVDLDTKHVDGLQLDPSHLTIEAAVGGLGVILESSILVERHVATGALVAPFPGLTLPGLSYWLFAPSKRKSATAVDAVMEWLEEQAPRSQLPEERGDLS
jgi:LysR family transcriptional regulator, glycine cleavage system transcriptional activator